MGHRHRYMTSDGRRRYRALQTVYDTSGSKHRLEACNEVTRSRDCVTVVLFTTRGSMVSFDRNAATDTESAETDLCEKSTGLS